MEQSITAETNAGKRDFLWLKGAAFFAAGLILALTKLFGCASPLAAAGLYAGGLTESIFMFAGAAVGYTISGGFIIGVPYIAAMGAIVLLRYALGVFLPKNGSEFVRIISSVAGGAAVLAANLFIADSVYEIFIAVVFGVISGVSAYCADKLKSLSKINLTILNNTASSVAAGVLFTLLICSFTSIQAGALNVGMIISALSVLYASDRNIRPSAAVCAVLSSAGVAAGNGEFAASCIMISVAAPVIMLLEKHGRITRACAFIAVVGGGLIMTGADRISSTAAISAVGAAVIYIAVPDRFLPFDKIALQAEISASPKPYMAFGRKLGNIGAAIDEMKMAVEHTAQALEKENIRDISWVYNKAADNVCRNCPGNMTCWGQLYNDTADIMNKAVVELRNGRFLNRDMLGGHLADKCTRRDEMAIALNKQYAAYCSAESASRKIEEMRLILTGQLGTTGNMLRRMSEEIEQNDTYDEEASAAAERVLTDLGAEAPAVLALRINNRLCIDAYGTGCLSYPPEEIADRLSFELRREFDLPVISDIDGRMHFTISERARYDTRIRVFRKSRTGTRSSGDCTCCFNDGHGNVYMILSDGMGSGSRARIDSAFSCSMLEKLLKAGIDLDSALEMLNSSLLVKSPDESFATLDICRIDLNTGDVLLCKAGGASTFVRCGNSFNEIKEDGLPLGIGFEANYRGKLFRLSEGDAVIMTSDGAEIDRNWLEQLVMRDKRLDINSVIETVGEALRLSSDKENADDMTVIGVKIIR